MRHSHAKHEDVEEAASALLTASRALVGVSLRSVAAAPVPLTVPQHRLLVLVSSAGPHRVGSLAADLGVNQSNASRLVDRLVAQGLVDRARDPDDARVTTVSLTGAGRAVLDRVTQHRLRELRALVAELSPQARSRLVTALGELDVAARELDAARGDREPG